MQQLNKVGVYMYLDAGHAGWLGWPANLAPAAQLFNELYVSAGSPQFVRGLATDVANYNALRCACSPLAGSFRLNSTVLLRLILSRKEIPTTTRSTTLT